MTVNPRPGEKDVVRVLIVDDDTWTARALAQTITASGQIEIVAHAHEGTAAVELFRIHRPDVVLMDVSMPRGMNGIDATERMMGNDAEAKIILITTSCPSPALRRALASGALGAVAKDAPADVLVDVVLSVVAGPSSATLREQTAELLHAVDASTGTDHPVPRLTAAELQTLQLLARGWNYEEIAAHLVVSVNTVKTHTSHLRQKLDARNLQQLLVTARAYRFIDLP
ncbi:response regulator transcription factor [Brachybacterium sp. UMB0905]|uniref:response regulator n=1 Tax=Brachybacterium sp. UMB0905 TaxID=2069310 RepID=UPI000C80B991|nr:response regulator transcription factor [Brachybacterium sp. UMB0905]PMC76266.1 DNA-binding response regulator [Brachybacterium sp. UMB0905]